MSNSVKHGAWPGSTLFAVSPNTLGKYGSSINLHFYDIILKEILFIDLFKLLEHRVSTDSVMLDPIDLKVIRHKPAKFIYQQTTIKTIALILLQN